MRMNEVDPTAITQLTEFSTKSSRRELHNILRAHQLTILQSVPNGNTGFMSKRQRNLLLTIETVMQAIGSPPAFWA